MRITALIMAAGRGERAGGEIPKQYQLIAGQPVLRRTLLSFLNHPGITQARVVINPSDNQHYETAVAGLAPGAPIHGGDSRQASARKGLETLASDPPDLVLIHDAARPFVEEATISAVIAALHQADGAIAAIPVTDSLKHAGEDGVLRNVARDNVWRALTPQGFRFQAILDAHRLTAGMNLADDAAVAERTGLNVRLVRSAGENFKITHAEDFSRAENMLRRRLSMTRCGMGYDVHRFAPGDRVVLCGVEIPHDKTLSGHSDADAALHALTDAILGALAKGDIGQHFPPSDAQWKGAPSHIFLRHAGKLVREAEGEIVNLDVTIICEAPRIAPYRQAMQQRIAEILNLPPARVSVKATTTETLGFTGRGEGIAAQALAVISVPA